VNDLGARPLLGQIADRKNERTPQYREWLFMKKRLFHLSMLAIVMFLLAMPLWLVALLDSKPGTTLVVTERFFSFFVVSLAASYFLFRVLDAMAMKPEMRNALAAAVAASITFCVLRAFPPLGQRHEALAHIAQLSVASFVAVFPAALCWELWRSRRRTRNAQLSRSPGYIKRGARYDQ
jgi:hypothetical protein